MRVTVAEEAEPPCTVAGERLTELSAALGGGGAGAVTVSVAERVTAAYVAEITEVVVEPTLLVVTDADAEVAPAGTVTVAGTVATGLLLLSDTAAPPLGAGALRVTETDAEVPPCTVLGLRPTELSDAFAGGDVTVHPDSRTFTGAAEPSLTSTVQSAGRV